MYVISIPKYGKHQPKLRENQTRRFVWVSRDILRHRGVRRLDAEGFRLFMMFVARCEEGHYEGTRADILDEAAIKSNHFDLERRLENMAETGLIEILKRPEPGLKRTKGGSNHEKVSYERPLNDVQKPLGIATTQTEKSYLSTYNQEVNMEGRREGGTASAVSAPQRPPRYSLLEVSARALLAASRGVLSPGHPDFTETSWKKHRLDLLAAAKDGRTPEEMAQATENALRSWSKRKMVNPGSVARNIDELLAPAVEDPVAASSPIIPLAFSTAREARIKAEARIKEGSAS